MNPIMNATTRVPLDALVGKPTIALIAPPGHRARQLGTLLRPLFITEHAVRGRYYGPLVDAPWDLIDETLADTASIVKRAGLHRGHYWPTVFQATRYETEKRLVHVEGVITPYIDGMSATIEKLRGALPIALTIEHREQPKDTLILPGYAVRITDSWEHVESSWRTFRERMKLYGQQPQPVLDRAA
jgi:hypothetical protein